MGSGSWWAAACKREASVWPDRRDKSNEAGRDCEIALGSAPCQVDCSSGYGMGWDGRFAGKSECRSAG